jgi:hypothetical protein
MRKFIFLLLFSGCLSAPTESSTSTQNLGIYYSQDKITTLELSAKGDSVSGTLQYHNIGNISGKMNSSEIIGTVVWKDTSLTKLFDCKLHGDTASVLFSGSNGMLVSEILIK